jgi:hypothetical protein
MRLRFLSWLVDNLGDVRTPKFESLALLIQIVVLVITAVHVAIDVVEKASAHILGRNP